MVESIEDMHFDAFLGKLGMYLMHFDEGEQLTIDQIGKDIGFPITDKVRYLFLKLALNELVRRGWMEWNIPPENPDSPVGKIRWVST